MFSMVAAPVYIPPPVHLGSPFSTSLIALVTYCLFDNIAILTGVRGDLTAVLISISLTISDAEHLVSVCLS